MESPLRSAAAPRPRAAFWTLAALLLVALAFVLLAGNDATSVFDRDEARFALAVREMREHGELFVPSNFGEPRYHKPILAYWLALASEEVFGHDEFAWRLPSALAGLVSVAATIALARRRFGARVALRAGAILGTSLVFVVEDKILTSDALLLATTTLAFWAWLELREGGVRRRAGGRAWQLLFWIAVALGILAKAVNIAFLAAAACALAFLRLARERRGTRAVLGLWLAGTVAAALPELGFLGPTLCAAAALTALVRARAPVARGFGALGARWGLALCAALVSIWLVPALVRSSGAFLIEGLGHHMLARTSTAFEGHRGFPGYYVLTAILAFFPWAAWAPGALAHAWRDPRRDFLLAWVIGPWALIESMASKLPHYLLVALPALSVLVALEFERRAPARAVRALERGLFLVPCLALAVGGALLWRVGDARLERVAVALIVLALVYALDFLRASLQSERGALFWPVLRGALALHALLGWFALPALEPQRLSRPLGAEIARLAAPLEAIHLVRFRPASLGCYLPAGHAVVQDPDELAQALEEERPGLYVVEGERLARFLDEHPGHWTRLGSVTGLAALGPGEVCVLRREAR